MHKWVCLSLAGIVAACSASNAPRDETISTLDLAQPDSPTRAADLRADRAATEASTSCTSPIGDGTLAGTFQGQALSATHSAGVKGVIGNLTAYYVGFFDQGGPCSAFYPDGPASVLYIHLCDVSPGTYEVGSNCLHQDGGTALSVSNEVKIPQAGTHARATSGTITILSFDETCGGAVTGSFDVSFDAEPVSGTFATLSCGTVSP